MSFTLPVVVVRRFEFSSAWIVVIGKSSATRRQHGWHQGEMIRDLMLLSVKYRFGKLDVLPHSIQWLSDNGSHYLAKEAKDFA